MDYSQIRALRIAIIDEIKVDLGGVPFSVDHYRLAELRLQTAIGVSVTNMTEEVEAETEKVRTLNAESNKS